ncbi:MAG TPA: lysophospholipid acyltransferase family protein [bacterium]|nr:lysophospholipid acyltransferase family protein [bacterium]
MILSTVPRLGAWTLRGLAATWKIKEAGQTSLSPFAAPEKPFIYAVWHENSLIAGFYRGQPLHALASQSFDGELISRALVRLGWLEPARGSSTRGGSTGLLELQSFLGRGEHVLLTVDGPKGPRREAKDGAVKLARLSGCSVVPVAFACRPAPRLKSWDRMVVAPPFAHGVFWFGEELRFNRDNGDQNGDLRRLQEGLERAGAEAEGFLGENAALTAS